MSEYEANAITSVRGSIRKIVREYRLYRASKMVGSAGEILVRENERASALKCFEIAVKIGETK